MPTLATFSTFVIRMYFEDHNPPHVHAAKMAIADSRVIRGALPARVEREAADWIAANRALLTKKWKEFR